MKKVSKEAFVFLAVLVVSVLAFNFVMFNQPAKAASVYICKGNGRCGWVNIEDPVKKVTIDEALLNSQKEFNKKLIAPTPINPDPTANSLRVGYNLGGLQTAVAPLEKTKIVNKLENGKFEPGSIALNNSNEHTIAASEFTVLGAASQVNNTTPDLGNYDFVIPEPVVE